MLLRCCVIINIVTIVIMALFFQSFRNSSMPKRLLRYTLSKLDYFDTDALDIDQLDFAVGINNVFTLQDVGVKLQACFLAFYAAPFCQAISWLMPCNSTELTLLPIIRS